MQILELSPELESQLSAIVRKHDQVKRGHELHKKMQRQGYPNAKTTAEANREQLTKWGREQGADNVKSGWLDKIRTREGSSKGGKTRGPIQGKINAENGDLARGLHKRWHVLGTTTKRGDWRDAKPNPKCDFCISEGLIAYV
jgi:hypothetical protein